MLIKPRLIGFVSETVEEYTVYFVNPQTDTLFTTDSLRGRIRANPRPVRPLHTRPLRGAPILSSHGGALTMCSHPSIWQPRVHVQSMCCLKWKCNRPSNTPFFVISHERSSKVDHDPSPDCQNLLHSKQQIYCYETTRRESLWMMQTLCWDLVAI